ncbi:hypothetical protein [Candidatus Harpocratesius sp.]
MFSPRSSKIGNESSRPRPLIEQKADLYSILQTAKFLQSRFEKGSMDTNFYIRRMRYFYQQILNLQRELHLNQASILDIVNGFNVEGNFRSIISLIASTMDYKFNSLAEQWQLDPFYLARVATQVTSDFITLLDYLHIAEDLDEDFVKELLQALISSLKQVHGFDPFSEHLIQLSQQLPQYFSECTTIPNLSVNQIREIYNQIEEIVASTFEQFKHYLHLNH